MSKFKKNRPSNFLEHDTDHCFLSEVVTAFFSDFKAWRVATVYFAAQSPIIKFEANRAYQLVIMTW